MFHTLALPQDGLAVCVYTWVDPEDRAGYLFAVAGDNDKRHAFDTKDGVCVGAADFADWHVGALSLRHSDPLRKAEIAVELDGVSFRATYEAIHPAFSYSENRDGCPPYAADERFEQACRVRGTLTLNDREIQIDTTGQRDHSWGRRDWPTFQDWKWLSAQAEQDLAVNVMVSHARGETTHHGYVFRDGKVTPIVEARIATSYDEAFRQTAATVDVTDEGGHTTQVTLERFSFFAFGAGANTLLNEAGCTGTIEGAEAVGHFECGWDRTYAEGQGADRVALP